MPRSRFAEEKHGGAAGPRGPLPGRRNQDGRG